MGALRLCTWNVNWGERLDLLLKEISGTPDFRGLDVLALQEASEHGGRPDADTIAACLGPEFVHYQVTAQVLGGRVQANALVWDGRSLTEARGDILTLPGMTQAGLPVLERRFLRSLRRQ